MVIVPVMVVMSGALAFSAFTGTITTNVNADAGYLLWEQSVTSTYTYEHNTMVQNSSTSMGATNQTMASTVTLSVSNLAPGNWVVFNITVTNNGSVGFILGVGTITTTETAGLTNNSTSSSTFVFGSALGGYGYYYAVNEISGFGTSIDVGSTATYQVFVGLGALSGNAYEESSFTVSIPITVTSDP